MVRVQCEQYVCVQEAEWGYYHRSQIIDHR